MTDFPVEKPTTPAGATSVVGLVRERPWTLVVWTAMFGWSGLVFMLVRSSFLEFRTGRFDLGNMVQAVWSTAEGRPLETTLATGEQLSRLAAHVDPILVLLTPLWVVAPSPLTLASAQIAACALGALPVFWLARRHLESERPAALLALAYLAYPWLAWSALNPIHPATFAIPLFLLCIWLLDTDRLAAFSVCAVLAVATGELMGLPLACLGLWYWSARGHRRAGLAIAALGVAWTVVSIKVLVPAFRGGPSLLYSYFDHVGGSPEGVLRTVFTEPFAIVEAVTTGRDLLYLLALVAPLAAAFLLAPTLAAVAIPVLGANLLSSMGAHTNPRAHAVAGIIPFLIAASVLGLARVPTRLRTQAIAAVVFLSIGLSLLLGPWPLPGPRAPLAHSWPEEHVDALRDAVALIPDDVPVAATNKAGSHLSAREYFYSIPMIRQAQWVVIDRRDYWVPVRPRGVGRSTWGSHNPGLIDGLTARLAKSPEWRKVFERSDVFVFRRIRV